MSKAFSLPEDLARYAGIVADAIVSQRHNIRTVLRKVEKVRGDCRTPSFENIPGNTTVTTHREYGFTYQLDVTTTFFNPRLASERHRVAGLVGAGERVLVAFAGAGPFAIPAAAHGAFVVAVEKNPEAYRWLLKNIRKNRCDTRVTAIKGDAFDTTLLPFSAFDRAIIPTPYGMDAILGVLTPKVRSGGMLHYYTFKNREQCEALNKALEQDGFYGVARRRCGNVAPSVSRWAFDLKKEK